MKLPRFDYEAPKDLEEALKLLEDYAEECKVLAGGTDLLVRMKQRLLKPRCLVSLRALDELRGIECEDGVLKIGARTSLSELMNDTRINESLPALAEASRAVGAPSIQHVRGTIGGNLLQDTRCLFYNQSVFWRSTKPPCHKAGGQVCYAREGSDRCRSTHQSDTAPVLMALGAEAVLARSGSSRKVTMDDIFSGEGERPIAVDPREILTQLEIPIREGPWGNAYERLSFRSAIDFPIASAAACVRVEGGEVEDASIVIGSFSNAPLRLARAEEALVGRGAWDQSALEEASSIAVDHASAFAVDNVGSSSEYRAKAVGVLVSRALKRAIDRATGK